MGGEKEEEEERAQLKMGGEGGEKEEEKKGEKKEIDSQLWSCSAVRERAFCVRMGEWFKKALI